MKDLLNFFILASFFSFTLGEVDKEDANLSAPELIKKYKYPFEQHSVTTEDGYILTIYRIPRKTKNARPVLMVHGLLGSSADYLLLGPQEALAFKVFDAGFDVWLLNVRGTSYSRNHTTLNSEELEYWDFSFEEMGLIDVPTTIDYILNSTKKKQVNYIGYSQGTSLAFILLSSKPEYNSKIRNVFTIAPVAFLSEITNLLFLTLGPIVQGVGKALDYIGQGEFQLSNAFIGFLIKSLCSDTDLICRNVFFLMYGYSSDNIELNMYQVIGGHYPDSCSTKQISHYSQFIRKSYFRRYNYGFIENLKRYGSINPPEYDLSKIKTKVHLYYSDSDSFSTKRDVEKLASVLPNCKRNFNQGLNHLDAMFGKTAYLSFENILEVLKKDSI